MLAQTGCVAEAARQMRLTRSALSHALRTLEAELGLRAVQPQREEALAY